MKLSVGIAQFAPEVPDLDGSVRKAVSIIDRAKKEGISFLVFPETWIPVYPIWADLGKYSEWGNEVNKNLHRRLHQLLTDRGKRCHLLASRGLIQHAVNRREAPQ